MSIDWFSIGHEIKSWTGDDHYDNDDYKLQPHTYLNSVVYKYVFNLLAAARRQMLMLYKRTHVGVLHFLLLKYISAKSFLRLPVFHFCIFRD